MSHHSFAQRLVMLLALLAVLLLPASPARADIAPPEPPPGVNILPGQELTQVRMLAETVVFNVHPPAAGLEPFMHNVAIVAQARVTATFTMRNLGSQAESMAVRFPLDYWVINYDESMPDIDDLQAKVDGRSVTTRHVQSTEDVGSWSSASDWSEFDVTFPPGQDVIIEITYTSNATGFDYEASEQTMVFQYILETGAGWAGTIGSADIIMRLPYAVSTQNVLDEGAGFGTPSPGFTFEGNDIHWHFEDFEPTREDNIMIPLVRLAAWQAVVDARQAVKDNPNDGEAWGRLGMRIKAVMWSHHTMRMDPGAESLYLEARQAYERCLELLPNDGLWHFGYADLLWSYYNTEIYLPTGGDIADAVKAVRELQLSMQLAPNNDRAYDILCWMYYEPGYLSGCGDTCSTDCAFDKFVFLALTATPVPPTPWVMASETPTATTEPSATPVPPTPIPSPKFTDILIIPTTAVVEAPAATVAQPTATVAQPTVTQAAAAPANPPKQICPASLGAIVALVGLVVWGKRRGV